MMFLVKVRIDMNRMPELGEKLQSGELDTGSIKATYCLVDDPAVGISIWEAEDRAGFDQVIKPLIPYYQEVMEISPVFTAGEAKQALMEQLTQ